MEKSLWFFMVFFYVQNSFSQDSIDLKKIYDNEDVQVQAEFPKGQKKFNDFVLEKLTNNLNYNVDGEILVNFVVEIDGSVSNLKIDKNTSPFLEDEIKKVFYVSPIWRPAEHEGYKVKSKIKFTIKFSKVKTIENLPKDNLEEEIFEER